MRLTKKDVLDFIHHNKLGVLSTLDNQGFPHAAPVYYMTDEALNFYFMTATQTTKHKNILQRSHVALTIVSEEKNETVQIKGEAKEAPEQVGQVLQMLADKHIQNNKFPETLPFLSYKKTEYMAIKIIPSEIQMRHYEGSHMDEIVI